MRVFVAFHIISVYYCRKLVKTNKSNQETLVMRTNMIYAAEYYYYYLSSDSCFAALCDPVI